MLWHNSYILYLYCIIHKLVCTLFTIFALYFLNSSLTYVCDTYTIIAHCTFIYIINAINSPYYMNKYKCPQIIDLHVQHTSRHDGMHIIIHHCISLSRIVSTCPLYNIITYLMISYLISLTIIIS